MELKFASILRLSDDCVLGFTPGGKTYIGRISRVEAALSWREVTETFHGTPSNITSSNVFTNSDWVLDKYTPNNHFGSLPLRINTTPEKVIFEKQKGTLKGRFKKVKKIL